MKRVFLFGVVFMTSLLLMISCETTQEKKTVTETPVVTPPPVTPGPIVSNEPPAGVNAFSSPWKSEKTSIVIDAYEGNTIDWDKMATDKRMVGVIHRSSIGMRLDTLYKERRKIAKERGYLWGAYHLGNRGDTIKQADFFLSLVEGDDLIILDLEDTGSSKFMSIDEAIVFMEYVYKKTGKIPVVYANHATTVALNSKVKTHSLFKQSKLWYARFKSSVSDFPKGVWESYFLWQFSSEINCSKTGTCLYNVPGTQFGMDVNVFLGSPEQLKNNWRN